MPCWLLAGLPPGHGLHLLQWLQQPPCHPHLSSPIWCIIHTYDKEEDNTMYKLNYLRHIDILGQEKPLVATLWHSPPLLPRETPYRQQLQHRLPVACCLFVGNLPSWRTWPSQRQEPNERQKPTLPPPPWRSGNSSLASPGSWMPCQKKTSVEGATIAFLEVLTENLYRFIRTM